jgi:hypothetical protein
LCSSGSAIGHPSFAVNRMQPHWALEADWRTDIFDGFGTLPMKIVCRKVVLRYCCIMGVWAERSAGDAEVSGIRDK